MVAVASSRSNSTAARRSASFTHLASVAMSRDELNDEDEVGEDDDGGSADDEEVSELTTEVVMAEAENDDEPTLATLVLPATWL